jgi:hypothetical protein
MGYELEQLLKEVNRNRILTKDKLEKLFDLILDTPLSNKSCQATSSCEEFGINVDGRYICKMHFFYEIIVNKLYQNNGSPSSS